MLKHLLLLAAVAASQTPAAQPLASEAPPSERTTRFAAHSALESALTTVVHDGGIVLLWNALPGAGAYVVEAARPGSVLAEVDRRTSNAASDSAGYAVRLDLPDGDWAVRLVATGVETATQPRTLTIERPDPFDADGEVAGGLYALVD